jgi:hypothetical protein
MSDGFKETLWLVIRIIQQLLLHPNRDMAQDWSIKDLLLTTLHHSMFQRTLPAVTLTMALFENCRRLIVAGQMSYHSSDLIDAEYARKGMTSFLLNERNRKLDEICESIVDERERQIQRIASRIANIKPHRRELDRLMQISKTKPSDRFRLPSRVLGLLEPPVYLSADTVRFFASYSQIQYTF